MSTISIFLVISLILFLSPGVVYSDCSGECSSSSSSSSASSSSCSCSSHESRPKYEVTQTVSVNLYYESLCPDCISEYPQLQQLMKDLGDHIRLQTYPYGNARMHKDDDGKLIVECQHGEAECYGNKLHACAIDYIRNNSYVDFNACMMQRRSNDPAADQCGQLQNISVEPIKTCAKGEQGENLLIHYGRISEKIHFPGVPYVTIDGNAKPDDEDLKRAVCDALDNKPDACKTRNYS